MLIHYALLFDNEEVFQMIYEHECAIAVQKDTHVRLSNQELHIPQGTTVMQLAALLNAQRCVSAFVRNVDSGVWQYNIGINK